MLLYSGGEQSYSKWKKIWWVSTAYFGETKYIYLSNTWGKGWWRGCVGGGKCCEENETGRWLCEVSRRRGRDEQEVNIKLGSEQNHLFLCFCFCFLALLELSPLITASKLVIVQSTAYVRLLWKGCRGTLSSTIPQSQPQSVQFPLRDDLCQISVHWFASLFLGASDSTQSG